MTPEFVHFPDLVAVKDRLSALRAIDEITEQGEGRKGHRENSHFVASFVYDAERTFPGVQSDWFRLFSVEAGDAQPVRRGRTRLCGQIQILSGKSHWLAVLAGLFDSAYSLMLRMLAWSFEFDSGMRDRSDRNFCNVAIDFMPRVLLLPWAKV